MKNKNIKLKLAAGLVLLISLQLHFYSQSAWVIQHTGTNNFKGVNIINSNTAYAYPPLTKTTNGGINWIQMSDSNFTDISFTDPNTGFAVSNSGVYKSTNSGVSWFLVDDTLNEGYTAVTFFNANTGVCFGSRTPGFGRDLCERKTTNGGINWYTYVIVMQAHAIQILTSHSFYNDQIGSVCVDLSAPETDREVKQTANGGLSWTNVVTTVSDYVYYVYSYLTSANNGCILIYNNSFIPPLWSVNRLNQGTIQWKDTSFVELKEVFMANASTGYIVGNNGLIWKTTNSCDSWDSLVSGTQTNLNSISFLNPSTGYVVGENGLIMKTTTGGMAPVNFSVSGTIRYQDNQQLVTSGYVKALKFNRSTGVITTADSTQILSNGTYILPHVPQDTVDVMAFENDEEELSFVPTYYISTIFWANSTKIYPTGNLTDINIDVFRINNPSPGAFHVGGNIYSYGDAESGNLKDAIIYAKSGNVFKGYSISSNNGAYRIDSIASASYELICNRVGYNSSIRPLQVSSFSMDTINFTLSIMPVKIESTGNIIPEQFELFQNYPNPFNPSTKIKFSVPADGKEQKADVKLIIYNPLGQQISVLVNQNLSPGVYESEWDASGYSSGIYFYKLESGDYSETKKMVLIK